MILELALGSSSAGIICDVKRQHVSTGADGLSGIDGKLHPASRTDSPGDLGNSITGHDGIVFQSGFHLGPGAVFQLEQIANAAATYKLGAAKRGRSGHAFLSAFDLDGLTLEKHRGGWLKGNRHSHKSPEEG